MTYEIPAEIPCFVDRVAERERVLGAAAEGSRPFRPVCVSLSGMAGVGKTELAYEVARQLRPRFQAGFFRLDLDEFRGNDGALDPADPIRRLLCALGAVPEWSSASLSECHNRYLAKTEELQIGLVIDNAKYESELKLLLPASGASMVVVTSLGKLADLEAGAATEISLAPLTEEWAEKLFLAVVGDDDRRLAAEPEAARELLRLCGGLPLAIHVLGRVVRNRRRHSLAALLEKFRREGLPEVDAIWDEAYEGLGPDAARLYRVLAGAPGRAFTADAAAALLGQDSDRTCDALDELDAAGLIADAGNDRMQLPGRMREHAKRQVQRHGDLEETAQAQRRIVSWYLRQAQRADRAVAGRRMTFGPPVPKLPEADDVEFGNPHEWLEAERHALQDCVAIAYARGLDTEAWSLCEPLWTHYLDHRYYADVTDAFRTGLEAARRAENIRAIVRMGTQLARPYWDQERFAEAGREIDQALLAAQALGDEDDDRKLKASLTEFRGQLRGAQGDWNAAAADFSEALAVHEALENRYGVALQSYRLGEAYTHLGELERAAELLEGALRGFAADRENDRERITARATFALANVERERGRLDRARELYQESLESAHRRGSAFEETRILDALAGLASDTGDTAEELEHRTAAAALREQNGVV